MISHRRGYIKLRIVQNVNHQQHFIIDNDEKLSGILLALLLVEHKHR